MAETEKKKKKKAERGTSSEGASVRSPQRDTWQAGEELYIKPEETQKPIDTSKPATQRQTCNKDNKELQCLCGPI